MPNTQGGVGINLRVPRDADGSTSLIQCAAVPVPLFLLLRVSLCASLHRSGEDEAKNVFEEEINELHFSRFVAAM
jgi:hypothetical protein